PLPVCEVGEPPGEGLRGTVNGRQVLLTGRSSVSARRLQLPPAEPGLECLAFLDGRFAALLGFEDSPREDSRVFVKHLSPRHRVTRVMLVSATEKPRFARSPTKSAYASLMAQPRRKRRWAWCVRRRSEPRRRSWEMGSTTRPPCRRRRWASPLGMRMTSRVK